MRYYCLRKAYHFHKSIFFGNMTQNNSDNRREQEKQPYEQPKMQVVSMQIEERLLGCGKDGSMCSGSSLTPPPPHRPRKPGGVRPVGKTS